MKNLLITLLHFAVVTAKLCGPGGVRAVIAENLVLKQQLIVLRRGRQRAPNLALSDRLVCGLASLFLSPGRIRKVAIGLRLCMANSQFVDISWACRDLARIAPCAISPSFFCIWL